MIRIVTERPGGPLNEEGVKIRRTASAANVSRPAMDKQNWLLSQGASSIYAGAWVSGTAMDTFRVYHQPSTNCKYVVARALIERATGENGTITITPDDGAGKAASYTTDDTATSGRFDYDTHWIEAWLVCELADTNYQYHTVTWTGLAVRKLSMWEVPRGALDTATDEMAHPRNGVYAGLENGRRITDGSSGGIDDLLDTARDARDAGKRHFGWAVTEATAWSDKPTTATWVNVADNAMSASGFAFKHQAREIRSADTEQTYRVRICAKRVGTGDCKVRLRSEDGSDEVEFTVATTTFAWFAPDGGAVLDIGCDSVDEIYPEIYVTTADDEVHLRATMFSEGTE